MGCSSQSSLTRIGDNAMLPGSSIDHVSYHSFSPNSACLRTCTVRILFVGQA